MNPVDVLRRRVTGDYVVDEWGYDRDLVDLWDPLTGLRWHVDVTGAERIPVDGPALLVANRRAGVEEPFVLARGIRRASGRRIRFLGIPDRAPVGPFLRRIGGAVGRPDELGSLLRAGHLCTVPLTRVWRRKRVAGSIPPEALVPALAEGVPILPVALAGSEVTGRWRVAVGEPLAPPTVRGPLALTLLAEAVHDGVQRLLDEAYPPRWVFS
jgi:hypothetical protein